MARKSPPVVDTGCTWPMFRIFNFGEGHSNRRLLSRSSRKHLDTHAIGNGNLRSSSDVISTVDEKHPHTSVGSRRRYFICKSIRNGKNDEVANPKDEVTKTIVDQRFVNKNFQGEHGAGCQPNQLLDALQILYSNKELFLKLLKDPNSLLVKQIHDLPSSQAKQPYQVRSYRSFSYNAKNLKPSHRTFGRIKRKLRYVMKVRRTKQQRRTSNGVPYKFTFGCQGFEDGKKVKKLDIAGKKSLTCVLPSIVKGLNLSLNLKRREKIMKVKDSELCTRQEEATTSLGESSSRNTYSTASTSEQHILNNVHVEGRKSVSEMLNFGNEEFKKCTISQGRTISLPEFEEVSVMGGMKYDKNYHQKVFRTKLGLQKEGGNGSFSSLRNGSLQHFGSDISIRESLPGNKLHVHYDIPRGVGFKDTNIQNCDINNATRGIGSFQDSLPEVASSNPSPSQRIEDNVNLRSRIEHSSTESVVEQFTREDVTNSQITVVKQDESPVQLLLDKFEENHFEDLMGSSFDLIKNLTSTKDILDYVREILHAGSCDQMLDPSTFDELKGLLTDQLSSSRILLHCVIETFMEAYKNNGFPPKSPYVQAYIIKKAVVKETTELINLHFVPHPSPIALEQLVEKDFAKRGSWLNIKVDIQDIIIEVEEHVLEKLVLEIVFEMDIRSIDTLQQTLSSLLG